MEIKSKHVVFNVKISYDLLKDYRVIFRLKYITLKCYWKQDNIAPNNTQF